MHEREARELTGRRRELLDILPAVRRFALGLTGDSAAADRLLEATVVRVLKHGLPAGVELVPSCIRVCRELWSEGTEGRELSQEVDTDGSGSATQAMERADDVTDCGRGEVQAALAGLSDEQRIVLELVAVEGYSYRAAAAVLDVPIGRVMHRLARARGALIAHCRPGNPAPAERRKAVDA